MNKCLCLITLILLQQSLAAESDLTITTVVFDKQRVIFEKGKTSETFIPNRNNLGTCHPAKHLIIPSSKSIWNFTVSGVTHAESLKISVLANSNEKVANPTVSFIRTENTTEGILSFGCKQITKDNKDNPWTFVALRIQDELAVSDIEVLKFCDDDFYKAFDWSAVATFLLVVIIVAIASRVKISSPQESSSDNFERAMEELRTDVKYWHILVFIIMASLMLMLAFYFIDYIGPIFTACLCFSTTIIFGHYAYKFLKWCFFDNKALWTKLSTRICWKQLTIAELIGYLISASIMFSWLVTGNWVLNNIIGIVFVFFFLGFFKIDSLLISAIMLGALFFYDIYWVFYSDRLFNESVMMFVATNLDIPAKLLMPHFNKVPFSQCSLIGLGDLSIPGLVISYAYRLSLAFKTGWYYSMGMLGYCFALLLCETMMIIYAQGQPALLYISPALLVFIATTAILRKEFREVWTGSIIKKKEKELKEQINEGHQLEDLNNIT